MENYKSKLQTYTQKLALPLPVYETEIDGALHMPTFKCSVTVNGTRYDSAPGHKHKKDAEQSAAQAAIQDLSNKDSEKPYKEVVGKNLLQELLIKLGWPLPTFFFTREGAPHCPVFTSTVEINGSTYVGGQGNSKKEAETKAAFAAFQAINAHVGGHCSVPQLPAESREACDSKQPIDKCKEVKFELETITNSYTSKNQILVGTTSCQVERALEKGHAENIHAVGMGSRNSDVNNVNLACVTSIENQLKQESSPIHKCQLMENELKQESSPIQKCQLNKESEDLIQNQEYGSQELEENKQVVQEEGRLTESINKRNSSELKMDSNNGEGEMKRQRVSTRIHKSPGN